MMLETRTDYYDFSENFAIRAGILLIAQVGLVSYVAVAGLLLITTIRGVKQYLHYRGPAPEDGVLQPVSVIFLLAIFMDSIQAFGSIMSARWAFDGHVSEDRYCSAQAALKQIGNDGTALCTLAIAILTWMQIIYPETIPQHRSRAIIGSIIGSIILFLVLMIGVPAAVITNYYGNTGMWCWITDATPTNKIMRIASEYVWFWLAALVSLILYGHVVFYWFRKGRSNKDRHLIREAIVMGWYPIAYFVEIFPLSLVRFLQFRSVQNRPDHGWLVLASVFFAGSGFFNVCLWLMTGRQYGFSSSPETYSSSRSRSKTDIANPDRIEMQPNLDENHWYGRTHPVEGGYDESHGGWTPSEENEYRR